MDSREVSAFVVREVGRQMRLSSGNDLGTVTEVNAAGRAVVAYRGGSIEVEPDGAAPSVGQSININKGRGLFQADGPALYGAG